MGRPDESKQRIYHHQVLARAAEKRNDQLGEIYRERLLPKMEFIYAGLDELCDKLKRQEAGISANYFIEGLGRFERLVQSDYRLSADSLIEINEITFSFCCAAEGELSVRIEGKKNVDRYMQLLNDSQLRFKAQFTKDETGFVTGAKLIIERFIPVTYTLKIDVENMAIAMRIGNYETLGETASQFSPEAITENFMHNLGEHIMRRNKGFFSMDLSEVQRRRIRARVLYEQQQRAAELEAADKRAMADEPRKKGFFTRLMGR